MHTTIYNVIINVQGKYMKKILKYILIGVLIYITVVVIELCCIYAVEGDNFWNYLKEFWDWYKRMLSY